MFELKKRGNKAGSQGTKKAPTAISKDDRRDEEDLSLIRVATSDHPSHFQSVEEESPSPSSSRLLLPNFRSSAAAASTPYRSYSRQFLPPMSSEQSPTSTAVDLSTSSFYKDLEISSIDKSTVPVAKVFQSSAALVCLSLLHSSDSPKDRVVDSVRRHLNFYPHEGDEDDNKTARLGPLVRIAAGETQKALQSSQRAVKRARDDQRPLEACLGVQWRGLAQAALDMDEALQSWREATQLACVAVGYDHEHVAVLLNNIGVWHAEHYDRVSAVTALQESISLQRTLLKRAEPQRLVSSLYTLAMTMANMAICDHSTQLLQEARTILVSLQNTSSLEVLLDVEMERLLATPAEEEDQHSVATQDSLESIRSSSLFGNSDGIPTRAAARLSMELAPEDFISLGPLYPRWNSQQCIHNTVQSWLTLGESPHTPTTTPLDKESIPVDLDTQMVPNAELRLAAIHLQTLRHMERGETADALDLLENALRSHTAKYGTVHHLVGSAWHKMGLVHLVAGQDYTAARHALEQAVHVRTAALGADHPDVQASQLKIALTHVAQGETSEAHKLLYDIQQTYLRVGGYGHGQMPLVIHTMGVVKALHGDWSGAYKNLELAYEYQRRRAEDSPANEKISTEMACTLSNMAFCRYQQGKLMETLQLYEAALELPEVSDRMEEIVKENLSYLVGEGACSAVTTDSFCNLWQPLLKWVEDAASVKDCKM